MKWSHGFRGALIAEARLGVAFVAVLSLLVGSVSGLSATGPTLHFSIFVTTDLQLGQVVWTGTEFLYDGEGGNKIEASDASGRNLAQFAAFDQGGSEMRCLPAPTKPAYWPKGIYCHTPDNRIVRFSLNGSPMTELARLPAAENSDGALAFDTVGDFGYTLLAATGGSSTSGGQVFAIRTSGQVQTIGSYPGPGGADEIAVAPARFGSASGQLLIAIDQDGTAGSLLSIDRKGSVRTVASGLGNGINPIVAIAPPPAKRASGSPAAGVYLADFNSGKVFFAGADPLKGFVGSVLVGTELSPTKFWLVRLNARGGFETLPISIDLPPGEYNFEGSAYVP